MAIFSTPNPSFFQVYLAYVVLLYCMFIDFLLWYKIIHIRINQRTYESKNIKIITIVNEQIKKRKKRKSKNIKIITIVNK